MAPADIRGGLAAWVYSAHIYALVVPAVLAYAVWTRWTYVSSATDFPELFFVAAGLMIAGSAFEIAQNSIDRWYITADSASGAQAGFCDMLFCGFVTASQATVAVAIAGGSWWVIAIAVLALVVFRPCYRSRKAEFLPLSVTGLLAVIVAYQAFGDPVIFLQLLMTPLTIGFFTLLLKTGAQSLHGFTTLAASSGVLFLALAINNAAAARSTNWLHLLAGVGALAIVLAALWPRLTRLGATSRPEPV